MENVISVRSARTRARTSRPRARLRETSRPVSRPRARFARARARASARTRPSVATGRLKRTLPSHRARASAGTRGRCESFRSVFKLSLHFRCCLHGALGAHHIERARVREREGAVRAFVQFSSFRFTFGAACTGRSARSARTSSERRACTRRKKKSCRPNIERGCFDRRRRFGPCSGCRR